jgi:glycosyltransferase involved in cell wall biosynthesis
MRVALTTIGKFHTFDLARQLHQRGLLETVFTGYPLYKLKSEGIPESSIQSFPWLQTVYMAKRRWFADDSQFDRELAWLAREALDRYASKRVPACDLFMGLSSSGLMTGRKVKEAGGVYVCDRGSTHIRFQDTILREEYGRYGLPYRGIDPRVVTKEEQEYETADVITVPSTFSKESFVSMGVPEGKLAVVPYGVDLSRFQRTTTPSRDSFNVLFVGSISVRKGLEYLIDAFSLLKNPSKRLTLVGSITAEMRSVIEKRAAPDIVATGSLPQDELKSIMSSSHALVLPSIEDGFGLVMNQAMACGCPVIASTNTGGPDLIEEGVSGFIVPIRDPQAIADRLQSLADDPVRQEAMSQASLASVRSVGGWDDYGDAIVSVFTKALTASDNNKK